MTIDTKPRDQQHPAWCVDHRHEMAGDHGECHAEKFLALHDEHGPRLEAQGNWFDVDEAPTMFVEWAGKESAHWVTVPHGVLQVLIDLARDHPDALVAMLRHVGATLEAGQVPA